MKKMVAWAGIAAGLLTLLLPILTDIDRAIKTERQIRAVTEHYNYYDSKRKEVETQMAQASAYNKMLGGEEADFDPVNPYELQLTLDGEIMGYVEAPAIGMKLPLYHGADETVLMAGAGHLPESSLPVGGRSSHCVITAHSGMKEMRAFDRIHALKKGDSVILRIYGRLFYYEVTHSETVLPEETDSLAIQKGKDLLTLVTCTPYGINSHRLLVHCKRSGSQSEQAPAKEEVPTKPISFTTFIQPDLRSIPFLAALAGLGCAGIVRIVQKRRNRKL